jgi:trimethylamine--corrinoid protein Co-methyltransferase
VDLAAIEHGGNFLGRRSTRNAMRSGEVYVSNFNVRDSYEAWSSSGRPSLVEEVKETLREIISTHQPLPLGEDVERELDKIERRAHGMEDGASRS